LRQKIALLYVESSLNNLLNLLFVRIPLRFFKRNVVKNIDTNRHSGGKRALIYFKTDPLFSRRLRDAYVHTNNAEIIDMIEIFNRHGFSVDLVDRDATWSEMEPLLANEYDVYLANAAGNSAPLHKQINARINARFRIFFAAGPEPEASNRLVVARHEDFNRRTGQTCIQRRLVKGEQFARRFEKIDAIFYVGNHFSEQTYARYSLPSYRIYPSTSPKLGFDAAAIESKRPDSFMYFGGNGLICKGLDLVLEAFDGLQSVTLDVCGPASEADFWQHYQPLLERNPHIRFHGFVQAGGDRFSAITAAAGFQVFPGSAEGCATSVVTCMRRGVIPVTTPETGVDLGDFGVVIHDASVGGIRSMVKTLRDMETVELRRRVMDTYIASMEYTPERFRRSFEAALLKTLQLKEQQ
jgi:glycosyltransferase involved in cell wall biosynthesis